MKKITVLILFCLLVQPVVLAKDYAKIQLQELKKAEKYNTTNKYFEDVSTPQKPAINVEIKDPKLMKLSGYEQLSKEKFMAKIKADEVKYEQIAKSLYGRKVDNYNSQGYAGDFYNIYRIAERMIRANGLDYINWRIVLAKDTSFNAFSSNTNCITINTGAYDTLRGNDDALALLIGHEMAHAILGHTPRKEKYRRNLDRAYKADSPIAYRVQLQKYYSASKKMEYAADATGAVYVAKAGYDLSSARETLLVINTMGDDYEFATTHPNGKHRLENYEEARKLFMETEWKKQGYCNILTSDVLPLQVSSDRKSIVIQRSPNKTKDNSHKNETLEDMLTRFAYKSYVNGEFKKAEEYFEQLLSINKKNPIVYLYYSYNEECLYKQTGKQKYLDKAKEFANCAQKLDSNNKYIQQQVKAL